MKRLEYLLEDYLCGDLDDDGHREVESLLERDPSLREKLASMREAHDALSFLRDRPPPPVSAADVLPQIHAAIAASSFETRPQLSLESPSTRHYRRIAMAAVALLAVGGMFMMKRAWDDDARGNHPGDVTHSKTTLQDDRPTPTERGLERFIDAAHNGPIDGAEFRRLVRDRDPTRMFVVPRTNVLPVVAGASESEYR